MYVSKLNGSFSVMLLIVELNGNGNRGEIFIVSEAVLQIYHGHWQWGLEKMMKKFGHMSHGTGFL